ncbi:MAG: chemotaxis protein CheW [Gammaproteobacteria bacterium]|nr:chemotaxis protein CheW [Gammaproteobacteria bacterium]
MSRDPGKIKLMDQQTAVMAYLEDLLNDIPQNIEEGACDNVVKVFPKQKTSKPEIEIEIKAEVKAVEVRQDTTGQETIQKAAPVPESTAVVIEDKQTNTDTRVENKVPEWAEKDFQCLLFHVTGITLAVPLVKLNGVIPWNEDITPMPGHSPAFLGVLRHLNKNVQVMDTAQVILPDSQRQEALPAVERVKKIVLMDEGKWGLACDDIGEVITLQHTDVRWRTAEGRRAWLAGTVSERLCALLDTDCLSKILAEDEKS